MRLPLEREADLEPADLMISSSIVEYVDDLDGILARFSRFAEARRRFDYNLCQTSRASASCFQRVKLKLTGEPEVYRHIKHFSLLLRLKGMVYRSPKPDTTHMSHAPQS